jgi:hypothetical protein
MTTRRRARRGERREKRSGRECFVLMRVEFLTVFSR